ncbi:hypothetical protein D918_02500 [Trichuris suis]|nr:hypothetical protein D918_02500 [Trichuris suis]
MQISPTGTIDADTGNFASLEDSTKTCEQYDEAYGNFVSSDCLPKEIRHDTTMAAPTQFSVVLKQDLFEGYTEANMNSLLTLVGFAVISGGLAMTVLPFNFNDIYDASIDDDYWSNTYQLPEHNSYVEKEYDCTFGACQSSNMVLAACNDLHMACVERMAPAKECDSINTNCVVLKSIFARCMSECARKEYNDLKTAVMNSTMDLTKTVSWS